MGFHNHDAKVNTRSGKKNPGKQGFYQGGLPNLLMLKNINNM